MDTAKCPNGHENPQGQTFCGECGASIHATVDQTAPRSSSDEVSPQTVDVLAPSTQTKRKLSPLVLVGAGVAIIVIGLLGWIVLSSRGGTAGPLAETHTITGSLTASECGGGYDIANASVEIRDEKDKLIGASTTSGNVTSSTGCEVEWTIPDVPKASFYQVTIGSHGGPSYSYQDLKASDWVLDLSL